MPSKKEKYENDLNALIALGNNLALAIDYECNSEKFKKSYEEKYGEEETSKILKFLPSFRKDYQTWYSEAKVLIKQLLPDRLDDFVRYYEKPKNRNDVNFESYRIEDYLQGLRRGAIVAPKAAIPHFEQQLAILKSIKPILTSSLSNIKAMVQADLFDSEIEVAKELLKKNHFRAAGVVAGVVIESHLSQVCQSREIKLKQKCPSISNFNNELKEQDIIDVPTWRFIQRLGDLRNLCAHKQAEDPTKEQIEDLIDGVDKITKTVF